MGRGGRLRRSVAAQSIQEGVVRNYVTFQRFKGVANETEKFRNGPIDSSETRRWRKERRKGGGGIRHYQEVLHWNR